MQELELNTAFLFSQETFVGWDNTQYSTDHQEKASLFSYGSNTTSTVNQEKATHSF